MEAEVTSQAQPSWSPNTGRESENRTDARYDVFAAHALLMASATCPSPVVEPSGIAAGEEAGRELDALCASVVLDPQASRDIALLAADCSLTTAGALAFGCLLHLAGEEAAGFWWEFAAGAGEPEAAYLLMLDHKRRAEMRDEAMWRDRLIAALDPSPAARPNGPRWSEQPALSARLRQGLCKAAGYAERHEHEDLGDIWLPTPRLAMALLSLTSPVEHAGIRLGNDIRQPTPAPARVPARAPAPAPAPATGPDAGAEEAFGGRSQSVDDGAVSTPSNPERRPGSAAVPGLGVARLWMPPHAQSGRLGTDGGHAPAEWEDSLRVLDVLQLVRETGSVDIQAVARTAGITLEGAAGLLAWLNANSFTRPLDTHAHGPGPLLAEIARGSSVLQSVLDQLRDDTGAAIYLSTYTDGEISIPHLAWGPEAPQVTVTVDFRETPHASAVGKSLLSQLNPAQRADLLSRHRPKPLTSRTITDAGRLIDTIDRYGPQSAYFDVLEYSDAEVCAAISLPLAHRACSVALSLPVAAHHRLVEAAKALSDRSTGLLLALVLATDPTNSPPAESGRTPSEPARPNRLWTPAAGIHPPALTPHLADSKQRLIITGH